MSLGCRSLDGSDPTCQVVSCQKAQTEKTIENKLQTAWKPGLPSRFAVFSLEDLDSDIQPSYV